MRPATLVFLRLRLYMLSFLGAFLLLGCSTTKPASETEAAEPYDPAEIKRQVAESEVLKQSFVGFALYDPELGKMVVEHNADKYFVPASNTKLFTFYAADKMLGDSIPALKYVVRGDSLLFWGTGDPTFTHMDLQNTIAYDFLKKQPEKLYYIDAPFASTPFALNWGWDDYNYYYQPERNVFPIHGNVVKFVQSDTSAFTVTPSSFKPLLKRDITGGLKGDAFIRSWRTNELTMYPKRAEAEFAVEVPFITSPELTVQLLADTLKRSVEWLQQPLPKGGQMLYGLPADTVYKRMLQVSDNLLAEQLLVLASGTISDTLSVESAIEYALENYLADLPDTAVWVDGSGLSTKNMFTPRSIIFLLQKLLQERPKERLLPLLAVGGQPGTFRNIYKAEVPFVFGKSGSLSHVHNQSGYILTKSGKMLLYSFLNNNYALPTSAVRNEMERIMTEVHEKY